MIYTVTFNPSLDYIVSVDDFKLGLTNRTSSELILPGGKGTNVSTVLKNLGLESTALGFVAGFTGNEIVKRLNDIGIKSDFISIENAFPAIISKDDWALVRAKMDRNRHRAASYTAKEKYLLSGKVFCGHCGSAMVGHRIRKRYCYYGCTRKEQTPTSKCPQKMIRAEILEHWVLQILERVVFTVGGMRRIADAIVDAYEAEQKEQAGSQATLLQRKAVAEKKLNNLYKIFEEGNADEFDRQRLNQIKAELREINKSICETSVKPAKLLSKQKIAAILAAMKDEIFVKKIVTMSNKL